MTRIVEWDGEPFALLMESDIDGTYLIPPVVLDAHGAPIEGREVLEAIVASNVAVPLPVIRNASASDLAEIDQRMQKLSDELGVPIGLPDIPAE